MTLNLSRAAFAAALVAAATIGETHEASACGGCFVPLTESTQVTSHKMILSVSPEATTLWDQITYSGDPESFAWILPIKGTAEVGISADILFQVINSETEVIVQQPFDGCSYACNFAGGGGGDGGNDVTILDQEVVGPYETVQLQSSDPTALGNWLTSHGYNIPPDIAPVIDSYVAEQFNFLALKLVPGKGLNAMKPVRITTPGATPTLPLRMVAAGTGAVTPITLWVFGDGKYVPSNFPAFTINESELFWTWETQSSNYALLRQGKFDASDGKGWLVESAVTVQPSNIDYLVTSYGIKQYKDENGNWAAVNKDADLAALYGNLTPEDGVTVTRLLGQLSRAALLEDLQLEAAENQEDVQRVLVPWHQVDDPRCPGRPCDDESNCAISHLPTDSKRALTVFGLMGIAMFIRRRRRHRTVI
ncbi:MAG: DUF2330 domain-containing protein [Polyangiaceae bacterium]|nr:DUF2330 domain-containing protein [Polyangiaceae bacterium]